MNDGGIEKVGFPARKDGGKVDVTTSQVRSLFWKGEKSPAISRGNLGWCTNYFHLARNFAFFAVSNGRSVEFPKFASK